MTFELLEIKPEIIKALKEQGIESPTSIQKKSIPLIKSGKDVIGVSKTGSGKTASFGVPILESIKPGQGLQVLILAPVRELAVQISNELKKFSKYMRCSITTVFGGVALEPQIRDIAKSEIVVGTPGRLLDHLERKNMNLSRISCFVLDEADKMVEMGFIEDINKILSCTPKNKQVLLFGATISHEIEQLKKRHMKDPSVAKADVHVKEEFLEQFYYNIKPHEKFSLLVHLLKKEKSKRTIIFCSARSTVEGVAKNLRNNGIKVEMIHGKLSQNRRLKIMEGFNHGHSNTLVASAVAARGLDIKDVTHIFNYDLS
jgi:ATP-dependent RNA helicase DeaD